MALSPACNFPLSEGLQVHPVLSEQCWTLQEAVDEKENHNHEQVNPVGAEPS